MKTKHVLAIAIAAWLLGYWMGFWHGRTKELYESAKRYKAIPESTTWSEFLKKK